MVSMDNEFRLQQIVSPLIDGHKKCQIFLFVESEALVAREEGLTDESQRVAILMQYSANSSPRSISINMKRLGKIRQCQYGGRAQGFLQEVESKRLRLSPDKWLILFFFFEHGLSFFSSSVNGLAKIPKFLTNLL